MACQLLGVVQEVWRVGSLGAHVTEGAERWTMELSLGKQVKDMLVEGN